MLVYKPPVIGGLLSTPPAVTWCHANDISWRARLDRSENNTTRKQTRRPNEANIAKTEPNGSSTLNLSTKLLLNDQAPCAERAEVLQVRLRAKRRKNSIGKGKFSSLVPINFNNNSKVWFHQGKVQMSKAQRRKSHNIACWLFTRVLSIFPKLFTIFVRVFTNSSIVQGSSLYMKYLM